MIEGEVDIEGLVLAVGNKHNTRSSTRLHVFDWDFRALDGPAGLTPWHRCGSCWNIEVREKEVRPPEFQLLSFSGGHFGLQAFLSFVFCDP